MLACRGLVRVSRTIDRRPLPGSSTILAAAVAVLSIVAGSSPAQNKKGIERTTTSEITTRTDKEKGIIATTTNRRFTFTRVYPGDSASDDRLRTLLLLE